MNRFFSAVVFGTLFFLSGCTIFQPTQRHTEDEIIIGKVGEEPVTYNELITQYNKSNPVMAEPDPESDQGLSDFLPLYMDYRMKLAVARDAGYLDDPEILSELEQYERQAAYPFWLERHIKEQLLDELYERSRELVHAKHILISLPEDAAPSDTLEVYEQLMEARERFLRDEENFMDLSDHYSSRQRGQSMGGDLGYFSAGWAVKPFEDAVYSLSPGEVSKPVRTSFGYHLIYLKDRKETGPDKHFSHIFFRTRNVNLPVDSVLAVAENAWRELEDGTAWNEVVEAYSEDQQSRLSGGTIGWVHYGRFQQAFTDTLMQIDDVGGYTRPFVSQYGIHIARLDSVKYPTEEERRADLEENLVQLPRYRENERAVLDNVAQVGNARFHRDALIAFEDIVKDAGYQLNNASFPDSLLRTPVFSFNDQDWTVAAYLSWLHAELNSRQDSYYHHTLAAEFRDHVIDSELISFTKNQFPEFSDLSHDYHTGLAVFRVNEDSIWTYARQDTARLRELFRDRSDQFQYDTRYRYIRFSARADSSLEKVMELITNGEPIDSIRTDHPGVVIREDVTDNFDGTLYSHLSDLGEGEFSSIFDYRNRRTVMYLSEVLEARPMTFEEAYNKLVTDYQSIRETEWLESMRNKYRVEYYPEILQTATAQSHD